jgi:sporulation protein YqfD
MPFEVPDLAWAAVSVQGILARVTVAERLRSAPHLQSQMLAGDVVAAHAGRIWAITTVSGTPQVEPGDEVRAGQILIRGLVQMPVSRKRGAGIEGIGAVPVHASGIVIARRWYSTYAEVSRTLDLGTPTGRTAVRRVLVIGAWHLPLEGWRRLPFAAYEAAHTQWGPPAWGPLTLPVQIITVRYAEVRPAYRRLSLEEARNLAAAEARAYLLTVIPAGARVVAEQERWQSLPGGGVGVELHVESEDNIGVFRPTPEAAAGQSKGSG